MPGAKFSFICGTCVGTEFKTSLWMYVRVALSPQYILSVQINSTQFIFLDNLKLGSPCCTISSIVRLCVRVHVCVCLCERLMSCVFLDCRIPIFGDEVSYLNPDLPDSSTQASYWGSHFCPQWPAISTWALFLDICLPKQLDMSFNCQ